MQSEPPMMMASHRASLAHSVLSARRCLVSFRVSNPVPTALAIHRTRWLLTASPALAPPPGASAIVFTPPAVCVTLWTYAPLLSPHLALTLHGLRAPPVA